MSKKNKVRYKSQGNQFPSILLTGNVILREREKLAIDDDFDDDDEDDAPAVQRPTYANHLAATAEVVTPKNEKGDVQIFLSTDSNAHPSNVGDFESIGMEGYLKANVWDGKGWKPLSLEEFFPDRINYFGKRERPIDTYNMCLDVLNTIKGVEIVRTYREHYRIKTPGDVGN